MTHLSTRRQALVLAAAAPLSLHAADPPADPWAPLRRFVGEWSGTSAGRPGEATVLREYAWVLGGRFLHERNVSSYPPQQKNRGGERHEHWGVFSFDKPRGLLVLRQFHTEGFINTYRHSGGATAGEPLVFDSESFENFNNSWRARETWRFDGNDRFTEVFELAPPGKPFEVYSRSEMERR